MKWLGELNGLQVVSKITIMKTFVCVCVLYPFIYFTISILVSLHSLYEEF